MGKKKHEQGSRDAPRTRTVRWLHLSDLHFEALERWDRRATVRALLKQA